MKVVLNISNLWIENLTVGKAAADLGMNTRTVTGLRKGTEKGDWATLIKLSRYFAVPIEDLLEIQQDD